MWRGNRAASPWDAANALGKFSVLPFQDGPRPAPIIFPSCRLQSFGFEVWDTSMAGEEAIWHVIVNDTQQGPLSKAQVLEFLRDGTLAGSDLIWCPGFPDWKPVSEINDFWQPPRRTSARVEVPVQLQTQVKALPERLDEPLGTDGPSRGKKWSLWKSANIGLLTSALTLLVQVGGGRGFELANYAHTASAETISRLIGQILAGPLIFVLVAIVRNRLYRRPARSSASPVQGAITFATLLVGIFAALIVYGEVFFSSTEAISGETRKTFLADFYRSCVQKQRSISQAVTEAQVHSYCTCVSEKMADGTTYKQLGTRAYTRAFLADLQQKAEAAGYACR
jgi:hypothetical protein